jgi:cell division protein FtsN
MKINWENLVAIIIGWTLTLYIFLYFITSCSIEHHLAKSQKHIDIAKRKGAVIVPDTVWQYKYTKEIVFDTITNTYKEVLKKDSTVTTINNNISSGMSRQERKALESYYKHLEKMMKLGNDSLQKQLNNLVKLNKQNQKTERTIIRQENKPWMWIAISLVALVFLTGLFMLWKIFKF